MKKKNNRALVGFSANSELVFRFDRNKSAEKGMLISYDCYLGGTSANVAQAISSLGGESKLLALTGSGENFANNTLSYLLDSYKVAYEKFEILTESNLGVFPIDGLPGSIIYSKKGEVIPERIELVKEKISKEVGLWRIATAVRESDLPLVKVLFENGEKGFRSLNPRGEFIKNREKFFSLLKGVDFLILNHNEFRACKVASIDELHAYGPRLIIVTEDKNGGIFSLLGYKPERFHAYAYTNGTPVYKPGAGDWFNGALHFRLQEDQKSFFDISLEEVRDFVHFAAKVAGKKITMEGAINGPTMVDL